MPPDIFSRFAHYFQLNLDKTSFHCNEGRLKVVGRKDKPHYDKNFSKSRFSMTVIKVGSASVVNGIVIFLVKG